MAQSENQLWQTRMQNLFTNTFPLEGKIKLSVAEESQNGRKKGFPQPDNQFPLTRIRLYFKKLISNTRKKCPYRRILFQIDRKSGSTSGNGAIALEYISNRQKAAYIGRNI